MYSKSPNKTKKVAENISEYSHFKIVQKMIKPKSPCTVIFCHDSDDFLVYVIKYKTKTGAISDSSIIIRPDIPAWTNMYEREGFKKE